MIVGAVALLTGCAPSADHMAADEVDWRTNPLNFVDRMIVIDDAEGWVDGESQRVKVTDTGELTLDDPPGPRYPRRGLWTSPVYETAYPITEALPSWSVDAPADAGVKFFIRTRDEKSGDWSPWLYIGSWGKTLPRDKNTLSFEYGVVDIDYLKLWRPADAYQMRAVLESFDVDGKTDPSIRKLTVIYSGIVEDPVQRAELARPVVIDGEWARTLDVPFFTQANAPDALRPRICSPTSVTMVMQYLGDEQGMVGNALAIYDTDYEIFGNWGRAVAYAGQQGYDAYLDRIRTWDQVKAYIAQGQPVIASIRFETGTFPSNVMDQTDGHLVVIRGLAADGDAIVNDSASKQHGEGIVYRSRELARAWMRHGGVAYIIQPMEKETQKVGQSTR